MKPPFFIEYAGMPVRLPEMVVCRISEATQFESEAQAAFAIGETCLPERSFRIVPCAQEVAA